MKTIIPLFFLFTVLSSVKGQLVKAPNIWDNILSQTEATTPIVPSSSFNFDFELPQQYGVKGNFDYNSQFKTATLTANKNSILGKINLFKLQVNLNTGIINFQQLMMGCKKYKLDLGPGISMDLNSLDGKTDGLSQGSLFVLNLFFKYIGQHEQVEQGIFGDKKHVYNVYQFSIDFLEKSLEEMLGDFSSGAKKFKQQGQKNEDIKDLNEQFQDKWQEWTKLDLKQFKFVILTDPQTGLIKKAYKNKELEEQLLFELQSQYKQPLNCRGNVQNVTVNDLKGWAKYAYENKDQLSDLNDLLRK